MEYGTALHILNSVIFSERQTSDFCRSCYAPPVKGNHDQKIAEWKNSNVGVASILAGFYQLAGRHRSADRIVTVRKTTGAVKTEQEAERKRKRGISGLEYY